MDTCRYCWLGTVEYLRARELQDVLVNQVHDGQSPNTLLLLEHRHVYTRGRLSRDHHLVTPEYELAALGVPVHETDRGGQITYHGPGQLVGYPIINLRRLGIGPLQYVRTLEQVIIDTLSDFDIPAHTEPDLTGVWTAGGKIAAIGVKISRGIAFHGFALNVNNDLSYYRHIIPCGITDRPVTSMRGELGIDADMAAVHQALARAFGAAMELAMVEGTVEPSVAPD
jgi:lipoate-protein ligase B